MTLRVPLPRRTSLCLPGVQSLNVPTADTGPSWTSSGSTSWTLRFFEFGPARMRMAKAASWA
ncbi:MAG TPA: hypothetical protein VF869_10820 [Jatrophihabitantaceae bacterium]